MAVVFTYGSLMFDEVWSRVVAGQYQSVPAQLSGYRRLAVKGYDFPGVIADVNGKYTVDGLVYFDVANKDLQRLDDFEGQLYQRVGVSVESDCGAIEVDTYLFCQQYYDLLADWDWCVEHFSRVGLQRFLNRYDGFEVLS
ncbi:hypothetical protein R50073_22610 [Maricurvus nonylphenolicus]|uniref:gamma-glutamylcyclotransferase family protein n=1 Tax=Maricurvus nonylphenolicus TaxID=1008307 RepID=UPI0036F35F09